MKITKKQQQESQELYNELIQKAWQSATFKEQLITNPVVAIAEHTGKEFRLHEGKRIVVKDQTDENTIFLNIPAKPNLDNIELSDEELESVAGGTDAIVGVALVSLFFTSYVYFESQEEN